MQLLENRRRSERAARRGCQVSDNEGSVSVRKRQRSDGFDEDPPPDREEKGAGGPRHGAALPPGGESSGLTSEEEVKSAGLRPDDRSAREKDHIEVVRR